MYDIVIIGGGIAAFTSALFAARRGMKVLVVAKDIGGQANYTDLIENYPGLDETTGYGLISSVKEQAEKWNVETVIAEVDSVKKVDGGFVTLAYGKQYKSKAVILAFGKTPRDLGVDGEEDFKGKGVSYCSNCDAPLYKKKVVAVAGFGDIGLDTILLLSKFAKKVYALSKTDKLVGHPGLVKMVGKKRNVEIVPFIRIDAVVGSQYVEGIKLVDLKTGEKRVLATEGLFVELGYIVNSGFVKDLVDLDEQGQIKINSDQSTSVPGIFAAGDVTDRMYKQAVISAGEAASAALAAYDWIMRQQGGQGLSSDWTQIKKIKS